jgi:hypothetical protein
LKANRLANEAQEKDVWMWRFTLPKTHLFATSLRERFKEFSDTPVAALVMAILLMEENDAMSDGLWGTNELRWRSPLGAEVDVIHIHLGLEQCLAAFQMVYRDKAGAIEVTEFFGRDETLAHLSFGCAEMLSARAPGNSKRVAAFAQLLAIYIAEKYTNIASEKPDSRGG